MKQRGSESDSETSGRSALGPEPGARFRVRVNMKRFFDDERALAYVFVQAHRRVRWLQRRLSRLFALPPRLRLLSRGHLLPPAEPLAVLRPDDPVLVLPCRVDTDEVTIPAPVESIVTGSEPHADVVDAGVVKFTPPAESPEREGDDELGARKLRALRILEQYCAEPMEPSCDDGNAPRPRRRRVRRRRRTAPYDAESDPPPDSSIALQSASVLRNGYQTSRAPRIVRSLDDEV